MSKSGKNWKPIPRPARLVRAQSASSYLASRVDELRASLRLLDPALVAARSAVSYLELGSGRGELRIPFWGLEYVFSWPDLAGYTLLLECYGLPSRLRESAPALPTFQQALLLYYLITSDGTPLTARWVSFADLPDGRTYNSAFQGYTGDLLVRRIPDSLDNFRQACLACGGTAVDIGSAAYVFQSLPRVPLLVTYWLGDEDFPSSCKILFDAAAGHYLPTDACAVLGSMLTRKLIKFR